jgi:hypothetical protein
MLLVPLNTILTLIHNLLGDHNHLLRHYLTHISYDSMPMLGEDNGDDAGDNSIHQFKDESGHVVKQLSRLD